MQMRHIILKVDDQDKALHFYTTVLGFVKKFDLPMGQFRWLTVTAPDDGHVELILEPNSPPPALTAQRALYEAGFPAALFSTKDIQADYQRLKKLGVVFRGEPDHSGPVVTVFFEDTCGNLINLVQS